MTEVGAIGITLPLTILTLAVIITTTLQINNIMSEVLAGNNQRIINAAFPQGLHYDFIGMNNISGPTIYRYIIENDIAQLIIRFKDGTEIRLHDDDEVTLVSGRKFKLKDLLTVYSNRYFDPTLEEIDDEYFVVLTESTR